MRQICQYALFPYLYFNSNYTRLDFGRGRGLHSCQLFALTNRNALILVPFSLIFFHTYKYQRQKSGLIRGFCCCIFQSLDFIKRAGLHFRQQLSPAGLQIYSHQICARFEKFLHNLIGKQTRFREGKKFITYALETLLLLHVRFVEISLKVIFVIFYHLLPTQIRFHICIRLLQLPQGPGRVSAECNIQRELKITVAFFSGTPRFYKCSNMSARHTKRWRQRLPLYSPGSQLVQMYHVNLFHQCRDLYVAAVETAQRLAVGVVCLHVS
ncbi:Hypothetical_protein [Hexamita inflata]|uniref:Hypothetical_protein n=1 Tax=Hexamita inflata TaxID=28002 RepID=A0AA86UKQ4_9EUKA|nr:Hypothetical protein HINF_LOCUS42946 [Hexamita inflata]